MSSFIFTKDKQPMITPLTDLMDLIGRYSQHGAASEEAFDFGTVAMSLVGAITAYEAELSVRVAAVLSKSVRLDLSQVMPCNLLSF